MTWFDAEAIEQERFDADLEMAELTRQGNEAARADRRMRQLRDDGDLGAAAKACRHGGGFPLKSIAASEGTTGFGIDPHAGEDGYRCVDCGSRLSGPPWEGGLVVIPCEIPRG